MDNIESTSAYGENGAELGPSSRQNTARRTQSRSHSRSRRRRAASAVSASSDVSESQLSISTSASAALFADDHYTYAQPEEDISAYLKCPICLVPFIDPYVSDACPHTFCKRCITTALSSDSATPSCPECRTAVSLERFRPTVQIIKNMLDALPVLCPHASRGCSHKCERHLIRAHVEHDCVFAREQCCEDGCQERVMRKDWKGHVANCPARMIKCETCGEKLRAREMTAHHESCPSEPTDCLYCGKVLLRSDVESHHAECLDFPLACPHAAHGCPWKGVRRNLGPSTSAPSDADAKIGGSSSHLSGCVYEALRAFLALNTAQVAELRNENAALRRRMEELESRERALTRGFDDCVHSLGSWYLSAGQVQNQLPADILARGMGDEQWLAQAAHEPGPSNSSSSVLDTLQDLSFPTSPYEERPREAHPLTEFADTRVEHLHRHFAASPLSPPVGGLVPHPPPLHRGRSSFHDLAGDNIGPPYTNGSHGQGAAALPLQRGPRPQRAPSMPGSDGRPAVNAVEGGLPRFPAFPASTSAPASSSTPEHWRQTPTRTPPPPPASANRNGSVAPASSSGHVTLGATVSALRQGVNALNRQLHALERRGDDAHLAALSAGFEAGRAQEEVASLRHVVHAVRMQMHQLLMQQQRPAYMPGSGPSSSQVASASVGEGANAGMTMPTATGPTAAPFAGPFVRRWSGFEQVKL